MQLSVSSLAPHPTVKARSPFAVRYVDQDAARGILAQSGSVLGVIGFGADRPDFLPATCPFIKAPLSPATGGAIFEIWTDAAPMRPCRVGQAVGACNEDVVFGAVTLAEDGQACLEAAVEAAYLNIFDFLGETGFSAPIRFWNYLTSITGDDEGLERYRRFNIGRHRAFAARMRQAVPPAASGVGGHSGASVIYFLAAKQAAKAIENPRQISAYEYPPIYGPCSPSFSRASLYTQGSAETLFISGTASIVGHETRHCGNLSGQIAETIENLRAVIDAAGPRASGQWAAKIYLQDPAAQAMVDPAIDAIFDAGCERLYLLADICRSDLLLEIEAVRLGDE